jgi:hypothetical protein
VWWRERKSKDEMRRDEATDRSVSFSRNTTVMLSCRSSLQPAELYSSVLFCSVLFCSVLFSSVPS